MNEKVARVVRGFTQLSAGEQAEFFNELKRLRETPGPEEKKQIREQWDRAAHVKLGPLGEGCVCCGK